MRALLLAFVLAAAFSVAAIPAANAANPQIVHFTFSSSNDCLNGVCTDTDFCGTGKTIDFSYGAS